MPLTQGAAGYSSASYMIQVFRRELETTPSKYRSSVRSLSVVGNGRHGIYARRSSGTLTVTLRNSLVSGNAQRGISVSAVLSTI